MCDYPVERIEDTRTVNGIKEYYIKWEGYSSNQNTWEPIEHLSCPDIIAAFEESVKIKNKAKKRRSTSTGNAGDRRKQRFSVTNNGNENEEESAFDLGLVAAEILGATESYGTLKFLMTWQNSDRVDLVNAKEANIKCPQVVIEFYEKRISWTPYENSADHEDTVQITVTNSDEAN